MTPHTCKAGKHAFTPTYCRDYPAYWASRAPMSRREKIGYKVRLRHTCRYDLNNVDQRDWNKLPGISFDYFDNHVNSAMLGWRWNTGKQLFEVAPYYHVSGNTFKAKTIGTVEPVAEVGVNEEIIYAFYIEENSVQPVLFLPGNDVIYEKMEFSRIGTPWRRIWAWFGGNRTAPHDMHLDAETVQQWMPGLDGRPIPVDAIGN